MDLSFKHDASNKKATVSVTFLLCSKDAVTCIA